MRTTWLPDVEPRPRRVAIGEFDGVHLGHQRVIGDADTVLTFEPHPRVVLTPDRAPRLLTPFPIKEDVMRGRHVRELIVIPFDEAFSALSAEAFIADILIGRLNATEIRVGENFRFGHKARGDTELLRRETSFTTTVADLVEGDGEVISSTLIRGLIGDEGDITRANRLLGMPFQMRGIVAHGEARGRTLGFPTANLVPDLANVLPAPGVYAARAALQIDGWWEWWPAAVSIGFRPMFDSKLGLLAEAYLIGYSGDCYGLELRLAFLERLRGEQTFASVDALVDQMHADVGHARDIAG